MQIILFRRILGFGLLVLLLTACQKSDNLSEVITAYEAFLEDRGNDDQNWNVYDETYLQERNETLTDIYNQLSAVSYNSLAPESKINYDMLELVIKDRLDDYKYQSHLLPLNAEGGFLTSIIFRIRNSRIEDDDDYEEYLALLNELPIYLEGQKGLLRSGLEAGLTSPDLVIQNSISILDYQLALSEDEIFFYSPVRNLVEDQKEKALEVIQNTAIPALSDFSRFLSGEYLQNSRKGPGIMNVPNGKAYYEHKVRYYTTLNMTPEEVFERGQSEVKRIREEMQAIIDDVGFEGEYKDFLDFLRTDPQFYAETGEDLLREAAWLSKKAEEILPQYFSKLPRLPFTVNPVPAAIAPNYTGGRYSGGSFSRQKAGEYWVNTYKLESRPLYVLPALTLHEAVPGHHLQISLAQELEGLPDFRKNTYLSAFGEGWGLYSEYLGKEANIYRTPYEDFGRLTYEMWRACRLVVDPGIHYFGWTRDQAVTFMAENTALSMHEVNTEIDRYIGWPAQAVSYKIGELKIRELRQRAEKELGADFDVRAFHDEVLKNGSIPLNSLERVIENYIKNVKNKST